MASHFVPFDRLRVTTTLNQLRVISYFPVTLSLSKGIKREATPASAQCTPLLQMLGQVIDILLIQK